MPERKNVVKELKVKSTGVFNFEDLYAELFLWFKHYGYTWKEIEYRKVLRPGGAYRVELVWHADKGFSDGYTSMRIWMVLGADIKEEVDVALEGGKKVKRQRATFEFKCGSWYYIDTKDFWKDKFMGELLKRIYEVMKRPTIIQNEKDAYSDFIKFTDELKAFLILHK